MAYRAAEFWASLPLEARIGLIVPFVIVLVLFTYSIFFRTPSRPGTGSPSSAGYSTNPTPSSTAPSTPITVSYSNSLNEAKALLVPPIMKDELTQATLELGKIPQSAPEYKEAQKLLTQIQTGKIKALPPLPNYMNDSSLIYQNYLDIDQSVTYERIKKNADRYIGKAWGFNGRILEIYEQGNQTIARVGTGAWGFDAVFVEGAFTTDFVEDDRVYVIGHIYGTKTYESQAGWTITIPHLVATAMLKPGDVSLLRAAKKK